MLRLSKEYTARLSSLKEDGFAVILETYHPGGIFCKLRHVHNGRVVTLAVDTQRFTITQKTNGLLKFIGTF